MKLDGIIPIYPALLGFPGRTVGAGGMKPRELRSLFRVE